MKRILIGTTAILGATGLKISDDDGIPVISENDYDQLKAKAKAAKATAEPGEIPKFANRQQRRRAERQLSKKGVE